MRYALRLLAACLILGCSSAAFAELVDNPAYQNWAKFKPGSGVTFKQSTTVSVMGPTAMESTITQKLVTVKPDSVTVEVTTSQGVTSSSKTTTVIPAKIEKGLEYIGPPEPDTKVEVKDMKEGKDTIDVKGAKVDAATHEFTVTMTQIPATTPATNPAIVLVDTMTLKAKVWTSPTVPGGMIKTEQNGTMGQMGDMKSTITLVDFTIAK